MKKASFSRDLVILLVVVVAMSCVFSFLLSFHVTESDKDQGVLLLAPAIFGFIAFILGFGILMATKKSSGSKEIMNNEEISQNNSNRI